MNMFGSLFCKSTESGGRKESSTLGDISPVLSGEGDFEKYKSKLPILFLCLILLAYNYVPVGLYFVVVSLFLVFTVFNSTERVELTVSLLKWGAPFFVVVCVGLLNSHSNNLYDSLKDVWYVLKYVVYFSFGYALWVCFCDRKVVLTSFVLAGTIDSLVYVTNYFLNFGFGFVENVDISRQVMGHGSFTITIALLFLFFILESRATKTKPLEITLWLAFFVCSAGFLYMFSRSQWLVLLVGLFVMMFSPNSGWHRVIWASFLVASLMAVLLTCLPSGATNAGGFFEKSNRMINELTVSNYEVVSDIHMNWRGYESFKVLEVYNAGSIYDKFLGRGWGKSVPLDTVVTLDGKQFSEITMFHNGYLFILLKAGIVGLGVYAMYFLALIAYAYKKKHRRTHDVGLMVIALVISLLFLTMVNMGPLNIYSTTSISMLIGMLFSVLMRNQINDRKAT